MADSLGPVPAGLRQMGVQEMSWFERVRYLLASMAGRAAASADVTTANAATQTGSYVQADAQSVATLANDTKASLNDLKAKLRAAGVLGA